MDNSGAKVVIISLDGATWDVLMPWVRAGHLPNIARFIEEGTWGSLSSTLPPVTAPAWASFQMGKGPGQHGLFHFTKRRIGSYDMPVINATDLPGPTLFQIASDAERRVCSINVPVTYPPRPLNGYMVGCLLSPSPDKAFWPPELWEEAKQEVRGYEILGTVSSFDYLGIVKFVDRMSELLRNRAHLARFLFAKEDWDLFMIHFQDTDTLQHAAWAWIDPKHPEFARKPKAERAHVLGFYRELDGLVGQLFDLAGQDCNCILMSDHGFGPVVRRLYINQWLEREGYLSGLQQKSLRGQATGWVETAVRRADVLKLRRRLIRPRGRMDTLVGKITGSNLIDWQHTRAYAPFGPIYAGIYINTAGREPEGTVQRGPEWHALRDELRGKLLGLVDPATNMRAVREVHCGAEIYKGPQAELLPDLVLVPADGYQFATTFRRGLLFEKMPDFLTGTHRMTGILALRGPAFVPGSTLTEPRIEDLTPTILYLLGLPVPEDMEGRALTSVLKPELLTARPVRSSQVSRPGSAASEDVFSDEESRELTDRLTKLGYLS